MCLVKSWLWHHFLWQLKPGSEDGEMIGKEECSCVVGGGDAEMSVFLLVSFVDLLGLWYFVSTNSPFHAYLGGLLDLVKTAHLYLPFTTLSPLAFSVLGIDHDVFQSHHEDVLPGFLNLALLPSFICITELCGSKGLLSSQSQRKKAWFFGWAVAPNLGKTLLRLENLM